MSTVAYMCPSCGAPLEYSAESGKLECAACGSSYALEEIEVMPVDGGKDSVRFERPQETFEGGEEEIQAYICKSCGAELMTEETTTATECPYCGSPTILPDRIEGSIKPELVVPFTVTKEQAQKQFEDYFKGKKLMPNIFLNSRNRISEMRKLYVPYWLFDCKADGDIVYDARKKHSERRGDWEIEHTDHYIVRRTGSMEFENIPVDGSEKLDNKITESLEPYDLDAAVPFQSAVLAGAMADHADVDAEACEERAVERVKHSVSDTLRNTVHGYSSVNVRSSNISAEDGVVKPVLLPVWLITTEKEGKIYTFAINGQTGKLTCDVPADTKKSILWCGGIFAGVFGIAALILALLEMLESGTLLIGAIVALIAMLIGFAILKGQLQQAVSQSSAAGYVKEGSFKLHVHYDRFLYRTTTRRKIETQKK
ncbi:MAG: hypothetical protein E7335_08470 [Clostridiales bacterium]|nr:hypothetical protein [Clostridiales bacterium]